MIPTREQMAKLVNQHQSPDSSEPAPDAGFDAEIATLVARIQAGERDLFGELYHRCFDPVFGYLRMLLNDVHEAEDVSQQVFLKLFETLSSYRRQAQPFRAWLFTLVRHQALNHLRKLNRSTAEDPAALDRRRDRATPEPALNPLEWLTDSDLLVLIEHMPLVQRQVLLLRYMFDLKTKDIATILDRSHPDVRSLQHRALKFLNARLTALGREPKVHDPSDWQARKRQARVVRDRRYILQR